MLPPTPPPIGRREDVAEDDAAEHRAHVGSTGAAVVPGVGPLRRLRVVVRHRLRLRRQHRRTVGVRDRLVQVGSRFVLRGLQLPHGLGEPGARLGADAAAAHVDEVRHRSHPRLRGEQRLVEGATEPLGRLAFLGDARQQPVQIGVGLSQLGERAQWIRGAGALCVCDGLDRDVARGTEFGGVRGVALRQSDRLRP